MVVQKILMQILRTAISILYDLSANFWNPISGTKDLTANIPDHYQWSQRFESKSFALLSAVSKIWMQILGTTISGPKDLDPNLWDRISSPKDLKANLQDHCQRFQRFEFKLWDCY